MIQSLSAGGNYASPTGSVILIGFMGAGKSTVGKELSRLSGLPFVDLDREIVRGRGMSIPEIFAAEGEGAFRDYETAALRGLAASPAAIVATGGGIVGREENRRLIRSIGRTFYLRARWETLLARLTAAAEGRPLADGNWEKVRELWFSRLPLYEQADFIIDTDEATPGRVARQIFDQFRMEPTRCSD
jgi:shikimate kinase